MMSESEETVPSLSEVTLVAVTSVNIEATVDSLAASITATDFGAVKLLSHQRPASLPINCEFVEIAALTSARAYSDFILRELVEHVETSYCLLVQWDGYVVCPSAWRPDFLDYDYIGARWPQFSDGLDVGNGGFSLRSRALMEACRQDAFQPSHPEDLAIGRENRAWLESQGLRFAPRELADAFSAERAGNIDESFGFHGVWHMPRVLGNAAFYELYLSLDERGSVEHDFQSLVRQVVRGKGGIGRAARLIRDQVRGYPKKRARFRKILK